MISTILSPPGNTLDVEKRKEIVKILEKANIRRIMLQMYSEKNHELNLHLQKFSENNPEFNVNPKNIQLKYIGGRVGSSSKMNLSSKNALTLLENLNRQMNTQESYAFFVSLIENMLLLPKAGKAGLELWGFLSVFAQCLVNEECDSIQELIKTSYNVAMSLEKEEEKKEKAKRIQKSESQIESLYQKIDELNHELERYKSFAIKNPNRGGLQQPPVPGNEEGTVPPPPPMGTEGEGSTIPPPPGMEGSTIPPPPGMEGEGSTIPPPPGMEGESGNSIFF